MASTPESGFLLLADLTGYTAYLSGAEIEHAPTIAGDLLETVVGRLEPPFRLAKLEGDAAFMFVEDGRAEPSLLIDAVEACYVAFRRRLRSIEQATSCDCAACSRAPLAFGWRSPASGRPRQRTTSVAMVIAPPSAGVGHRHPPLVCSRTSSSRFGTTKSRHSPGSPTDWRPLG